MECRPEGDQGRLGPLVRQMAVGSAAEAVIRKVEVTDQGLSPIVAEGCISVAFQGKGKVSVQMLFFVDLLSGENLADAVYTFIT